MRLPPKHQLTYSLQIFPPTATLPKIPPSLPPSSLFLQNSPMLVGFSFTPQSSPSAPPDLPVQFFSLSQFKALFPFWGGGAYNSHTIHHFNHFKVYSSMAFSTFTMLCKSHHYWVPEHFHPPQKETLSSFTVTPPPPPPAPGNHSPTLHLCGFAYSGCFI